MPFQRLGRDTIDLDRELLYPWEVDREGIDEGGENESFTLYPAGKVLNDFTTEIDGGGRPIDPHRGRAAGQEEEGEESRPGILAQGKEEILQTGRFIRTGRSLLDDTG